MRGSPALLAALVLAGCAGALGRGESQFDEGRYPEAKNTFAALEAESHGWSDAKRAEYALYRGLTLNALGDRDAAGVWLREARAIEDAHPGSLTPDQERRLRLGMGPAE
ncbi:MAG: hypothetical protein ACRELB_04280 [Polyangiaceae bacterium]